MSDDRRGDTEPYPRNLGAQHPTVPLPRDLAVDQSPFPSAPPAERVVQRRRRRWPWVVGGTVVAVAVFAVGGELVARGLVAQNVRAQVITALDLPQDQQLDVRADGVVLLQLLAGRLDFLHVSSERIALGPLVGAASVDAEGVPLHGGAMGRASGTLRITAEQFTTLAATTGLPITTILLDAPNVTAQGEVSLFGAGLPLSATLTPGTEDGGITLTPVSATIGNVTLDADEIDARFGSLAKGLTGTQRICIADQIPAGLRLASLTVTDDAVVAGLDADGAIATDPALQEKGVCP